MKGDRKNKDSGEKASKKIVEMILKEIVLSTDERHSKSIEIQKREKRMDLL